MSDWIGRYRILRPLGEGGMGRLFLGEAAGASGFSRRVVVKVVKDELDPGLQQALLDEARLTASLVHRNIVPVLDLEESGDQRLVILEHVDGLDLRQLLERRKRLPWPLAAFIASEIAAGLDYAHRKADDAGRPLGIVHRDVSPANILLSWEGEAKLTDFGVAKFARSGDGSLGALKGNLGYMAPEQARGAFVDARADIFALGVVLYEAIGGDNPYHGRNDLESLAQLQERQLAPSPIDGVPAALLEVVARATAREPRGRFANAAALREALLAIPGQPADPARQLAQLLTESRAQPTLANDALLEAVLGGGRPVTQVKHADTVAEPLPPDGVARHSAPAFSAGRGVVTVGVFVLAAAAAALLGWRGFRSPAPATVMPVITTTPPPAPPAPAPDHEERLRPKRGSLSVNAVPWANIFLDGRGLGATPRLNLSVEAGRHHLRLVTSGGDARSRTIEVAAGKETRISVNFAEP